MCSRLAGAGVSASMGSAAAAAAAANLAAMGMGLQLPVQAGAGAGAAASANGWKDWKAQMAANATASTPNGGGVLDPRSFDASRCAYA